MNLVIRKFEAKDREAWERLYHGYLEFYESQPIASSTELVWSRLTSDKPEIQGFAAELDGDLVGIVHFHYQLSTWTHTYHCYLEDLFVAEGNRGKGIARALIAAVKSAALENKCSELFWITKQSNETAQKLYDKVATKSDFVRYEVVLQESQD